MTIQEWLDLEVPDDVVGPDHTCIISDGHGYAMLYTPRFS